MFGAALAVIVVLGFVPPATPDRDPSALVGQLGSLRFSERQRAEAALLGLGKVALPALRPAKSSRDLEIRTRAAAILGRIEDSLLVEPTSVSLGFRDVPISEAIRAINAETGLTLATSTDGDPAWADRRLTLDAGTPLPFWKAVDALCEAGKAHYSLGGPTSAGQGPSIFSIGDGPALPPGPTFDRGPFRVQLAGTRSQDEPLITTYARPGARVMITPRSVIVGSRNPAPTSKSLTLDLLVAAEPRLSIAPNGPVRVTEAFDEVGRPLIAAARPAGIQHSSGYFGMNSSPVLRLRADLAQPEGGARRIKRIRGMIPVAVATRKPDPLVLSLDKAAALVARNDEVEVVVREVRPARQGKHCTIELSLKNVAATVAQADALEGDIQPDRTNSPLQQIEVLDDQGRPLPWFQKSSLFNGDETRLILVILPVDAAGPPATIRHHGMIRGSAEIPFEFRDIALPL